MKTTNYIVMDGDGAALCDDVPEYEIERVAQAWADRLAETVYYSEEDDDEDIAIAVEPSLGAILRKRVRVDHAFSAFIRGKEKAPRRVAERAAERKPCATELLNALRPFANIAADPALMADVLHGMRSHEAATLCAALETARLLVERHGSESDSECS